METVSKIQSNGQRAGTIITEVNIDINRELTEDEKWQISELGRDIHTLIMTNSINNHPDTISEIAEEKVELLDCFPIGLSIYVKALPNGYDNRNPSPWYRVTTPIGPIVIGWRKRVINIDWSDSDIQAGAEELFPNENVTKGPNSIHAWGYEKAREYLAVILTAEQQTA